MRRIYPWLLKCFGSVGGNLVAGVVFLVLLILTLGAHSLIHALFR